MRFMVMMIPGDKDAEAGKMPDEQALTAMMKFNEELVKAGVMLGGEGLHPTSKGARVRFTGGKPSVTDGPFTEAREIVGGFWIWKVASRDEAIAWASRCPAGEHDILEIRQVFESEEFGPEVAAQEHALIDEIKRQNPAS